MKTIIGFICLGLVILAGNVFAAESAIKGVVKDAKGQPVRGADVRIEASGGSSWKKMTKTDGKGNYFYNGLTPDGIYRVSLIVNSSVKASINNVKTKSSETTTLNFDLKAEKSQAAATKKGKHFVWAPSTTGSHLGGHWVEVSDDGTAADAGNENVQKLNKRAVERMQSASGGPNAGSGGR